MKLDHAMELMHDCSQDSPRRYACTHSVTSLRKHLLHELMRNHLKSGGVGWEVSAPGIQDLIHG